MRSMTAWLLLSSFHQDPVPSQVTADGSCAHVTRPGTTPRGTPSGESWGSKRDDRMPLAAAIERANCRRVISILSYSSVYESYAGALKFCHLPVDLARQYAHHLSTAILTETGAFGKTPSTSRQ